MAGALVPPHWLISAVVPVGNNNIALIRLTRSSALAAAATSNESLSVKTGNPNTSLESTACVAARNFTVPLARLYKSAPSEESATPVSSNAPLITKPAFLTTP